MFLPSDHYLKLWKSWPTNLVMNNFKKFKFSMEHLKMFIYFLCRTLRLHLKQISLNNLKCFASSFRNLFECSGTFFKVPQEHSKTFRDNWSWIISIVLKLVREHVRELFQCSRTFQNVPTEILELSVCSQTILNVPIEHLKMFIIFFKSSHGMFQNVWSNKLLRNI